MSISAKDLVGTYILVKTNGRNVHERSEKDVRMKLTENGDMLNVHIKVANTIGGILRYADGKITGVTASTRMGGTKFQMMLETALCVGFGNGMRVSFKDSDLLLSQGKNVFRFTPKPGLDVFE